MPKTPTGAPAQPRRYDDVVAQAAAATPVTAPTTSNQPAGTVRDGGVKSASFSTDAREDDPGDRDRTARKPAAKDLISRRLEMAGSFSMGDRFEWCRDVYNHRMPFSRRYSECDVLVDLFSSDTAGVRDEVARKRATIAEHNALAKAALEQLLEESKDDAAFEAGMTFLRQRGDVPFGYVPMIGLPADLDLAALKSGAVLDLPPPPRGAQPDEVTGQIGVGVR